LSKKIRMPGSARAGLALLVVGAIFVGIGTYLKRGGFSLYGLIMVIAGFSIYMVSSIVIARDKRKRNK
jgi:membrane-bound ClpP family serine protease